MEKLSYYRLEEYSDVSRAMRKTPYVICSFKTNRFGYYQVKYKDRDLTQLSQEPSLNMFTYTQLDYMREVCAIVYRMVYDVPACKSRFE